MSTRDGLQSVLLCLLLALSNASGARIKKSPRTDADYISALSLADRFLCAWQSHDHEAGLLMLTDAAKQHTTENRLGEFFSGNRGPQAFIVSTGRRIDNGGYEFPVALLNLSGPSIHRRFSHITVIRAGKHEWAVDTLP